MHSMETKADKIDYKKQSNKKTLIWSLLFIPSRKIIVALMSSQEQIMMKSLESTLCDTDYGLQFENCQFCAVL